MQPFGILNIHKPQGITSRDAINRVVRLARQAGQKKLKIGHAGTLDPIATGVLVACIGKATRLIEYIQHRPKRYLGTFQLDCRSETDDTEGDVREVENPREISRAEIESAIPQFIGEIDQVPPMFSAIKVGGKRAYDIARSGGIVELKSRKIMIHSLQLVEYQYPILKLDVHCGSGTYIRSLGRDIARELGTEAVMSGLVRTAIGEFNLNESVSIEDCEAFEDALKHLCPASQAVSHLPCIDLTDKQVEFLRNGRSFAANKDQTEAIGENEIAAFHKGHTQEKKLAAILRYDERENVFAVTRNFSAE